MLRQRMMFAIRSKAFTIVVFGLSGSSILHSQCGNAIKDDYVCPSYCVSNNQLNYNHSGGLSRVILINIQCCSGISAALQPNGKCAATNDVSALSDPQIAKRAIALAKGKQVLVPGCDGGFVALVQTSPQSARTKTPWEFPLTIPLRTE